MKICVDLDGVLADFEKKVTELVGRDLCEFSYDNSPDYKQEMWDIVTAYGENGGEMWYEMDLLPDAMDLWDYIKEHDPVIITATGAHYDTISDEKRRWVAKHLGEYVEVHTVLKGIDKYKHCEPGDVMIDDKQKVLTPWVEKGQGVGILHTSAYNTISELKKLGI